jgi:hypothetical protein
MGNRLNCELMGSRDNIYSCIGLSIEMLVEEFVEGTLEAFFGYLGFERQNGDFPGGKASGQSLRDLTTEWPEALIMDRGC